MCFFVWHHVGLSNIPLGNPCVQKAAGTKRFQAFYEEVERLAHKLTILARSRLRTGSMGDADVDPYECLLLVKMLLRALMPKINAWAEAENFPQPLF
jgi:hypothetical protein